ncbi:hypothetical protein SAMN05446037_102170 [Anaerovirgula multivorans]|uniref:Uncharacterized protein n=1 Tax=Anaerovirgula multivorans TaxID=312168 RepID=A0A239HFC3_9FIRM|nr:hypothetical protein [Anaerovirgula multivorans]SNS80050.1 hypothetical protein SAMN05446037_102170 [Anaerovirgula multivorans]
MKTRKRFLSLVLCLLMIFSSLALTSAATSSSVSTLSSKQIEDIFEEIKGQILFKYGGIYDFNNFSFVIENERFEDGKILIDLDILTDMTLTRHPSESQATKVYTTESAYFYKPDPSIKLPD